MAASQAGFIAYQNLTVQTSNGAQAVFCEGDQPHGVRHVQPERSDRDHGHRWFGSSSAPMHRFDAYTVSGGKAAVTPSSLTIVNDVPAAGRGMASRVTADANNGIITYVQSATPDRDARPDLRHLPHGHGDLLGQRCPTAPPASSTTARA